MIDIEGRLADAGASWRAAQPAPPEPDLDRIDVRRRARWPALAAAAAAAAVTAVTAGVALLSGSPAGPTTATGPSATPGARSAADDLIVRDGDTVEASGQVVAEPGRPTRFCPFLPQALPASSDPSPSCRLGVDVTGVDLNRLTDRRSRDDKVYGDAWLRGVFRGGTVEVVEQAAPEVGPPPRKLETPPCASPKGGWRGSADTEAVNRYVTARTDRFYGIMISYPTADTSVTVTVVGVSTGDVGQAQQELRARFGPNICAVRVNFTIAEQRRVADAVRRLFEGREHGIYAFHGVGSFRPVTVDFVLLDQTLYEVFEDIGLDQLELNPWLKPVR